LLSLLSKTEVTFDGRASTNQIIPVAVGIDSSSWVSAVVLAKLHAKAGWQTGAQLNARVQNCMLVPEEPDVVYLASGTIGSVGFLDTEAAPLLKLAQLATPIGPMLRVYLEWTQAAVAAAGQTASISIDIVGRPA
jgi:hypothetical protein